MDTDTKEINIISHTYGGGGGKSWKEIIGESIIMSVVQHTNGLNGLIVDRMELSSVKAGVTNALFSSSKTPT